MSHICSVCSHSYQADYVGQFPVCRSCQWGIISQGKNYYYCNTCNKATLRYDFLGMPFCCEGDVFQVPSILNRRQETSLIEWNRSRGVYLNPIVELGLLVNDKDQALGVDFYSRDDRVRLQICNDEINPLLFNPSDVKKSKMNVNVKFLRIRTRLDDNAKTKYLFGCEKCNTVMYIKMAVKDRDDICYGSGAHLYRGSYFDFKCSECGIEYNTCYSCGKIRKKIEEFEVSYSTRFSNRKAHLCSNDCFDLFFKEESKHQEEMELKRKQEELRWEEVEKRRKERELEKYHLAMQNKDNKSEYYALHKIGAVNQFYSFLVGYTTFDYMDSLSKAEAIKLRDLINKGRKDVVELFATSKSPGFKYHGRNSTHDYLKCPHCKEVSNYEVSYRSNKHSRTYSAMHCSHCKKEFLYCTECKKVYTLGKSELEYFERNNYDKPKRCKDCRKANPRTRY